MVTVTLGLLKPFALVRAQPGLPSDMTLRMLLKWAGAGAEFKILGTREHGWGAGGGQDVGWKQHVGVIGLAPQPSRQLPPHPVHLSSCLCQQQLHRAAPSATCPAPAPTPTPSSPLESAV